MAFRIPENERSYERACHRAANAPTKVSQLIYKENAERILIADANGELATDILADSWEPRPDGTIEARRLLRDEKGNRIGKRIDQGLGYEFKAEPIVLDSTKVTVP